MQLRQRFEKAENDKAISIERLRELSKEHRKATAAAAAEAAEARKAVDAELAELRSELVAIQRAEAPSPPRRRGAQAEAEAETEELVAKNAALTLYCKRKNLEMRRLLNCYKSLKTEWERAGGTADAFDARAAEVDACFDLKAAHRRLEQLEQELTACKRQLREHVEPPPPPHVLREQAVNKEAVVAVAPGKENSRVIL
jgi:chromosome segregation ATPase